MDDNDRRFGVKAGKRPVSESTRITVSSRLEEFRNGTEPEMTFEADLSNHDRAVVHQLCRKMGFISKSHGKGPDRRLTVYRTSSRAKSPGAPGSEAADSLPPLTLSPDSEAAVLALLLTHPPTELEMTSALQAGGFLADAAAGKGRAQGKGAAVGGKGKGRDKGKGKEEEEGGDPWVKAQVKALADRMAKMVQLKPITERRQSLPIMAYKDEIMRTISAHQVVLIAGETGCGKTTQVPQFILDHEWAHGRRCRVLCTQPRRISATSVAERIAAERGETIGQTVGYQIRLESKGGPSTALWLCTNGVLLRRLVGLGAHLHSTGGAGVQGSAGGGGGGVGSGGGGGGGEGSTVKPGVRAAIAAAVRGLAADVGGEGEGEGGGDEESGGVRRELDADVVAKLDATHIIVDEVHERDRFADFMLIILRDILRLRPNLKLVLMSATLNAGLFANYFGGCPVINVPGFTYPVRSLYLEDVLRITNYGNAFADMAADVRAHHNTRTHHKAMDVEEVAEKADAGVERNEGEGGEMEEGKELEEGEEVGEEENGDEVEEGEQEEEGEEEEEEEGEELEEGEVVNLSAEDATAMDEAITRAWIEDDFDDLMELVVAAHEEARLQGTTAAAVGSAVGRRGGGRRKGRARRRGVTINICDYAHSETGATPLMVAAGKGRVEEVEIFLSMGADVLLTSDDGSTAMDWARMYGHDAVCSVLERHLEALGAQGEEEGEVQGGDMQEEGEEEAQGGREKEFATPGAAAAAAAGRDASSPASASVKAAAARVAAQEQAALKSYQASVDHDEVDLSLIHLLLTRICVSSAERPAALKSTTVFSSSSSSLQTQQRWRQAEAIAEQEQEEEGDELLSLIPPTGSREGREGRGGAGGGSAGGDGGASLNGPDCAILVFLPGWEEISRLRDRLLGSSVFGDASRFLILPLHSKIPMMDQRKVFERPPRGVRKIVLTTNIAETALTIDDIVFVVDSGRLKEKSYDPYTNVATLQVCWVSKASARQRQGRAGRCRPGVCFHLFSRTRADSLPEFQAPEIKRTPLEELCLQIKILDPSLDIPSFLSKALEPPVPAAITNAIALLQDIGALDELQSLTPLGAHLGALPLHPVTSKMLLHSILLDCLGPALTVAAASTYRDPFQMPVGLDQKHKALGARQELGKRLGGYGDHLALVAAFDGWAEAKATGGGRAAEAFCRRFFLSHGGMVMISGLRKQLRGELLRKGFLGRGGGGRGGRGGGGGWRGGGRRGGRGGGGGADFNTDLDCECNANGKNQGVVRAVLAAGLYPFVASLLPKQAMGRQQAVVMTARGEKVRIHPHSVNFRALHRGLEVGSEVAGTGRSEASSQPLIVFDEIVRGEGNQTIRSSTVVRPLSLILIASEMVVAPLKPLKEEGEGDGGEKGKVEAGEDGAGEGRRARKRRQKGQQIEGGMGIGREEAEGVVGGVEQGKVEEEGEKKEQEEGGEEEEEGEYISGAEEEEGEGEGEDEGPVVRPDPNSAREKRRRLQEELMSDPNREIVIVIDRWLRFRATAMLAAQLFCLRERLAASFAIKVHNPSQPLPPLQAMTLYTIASLLSFENYFLPPQPSQSALPAGASAGPSATAGPRMGPVLPGPQGPGSGGRFGGRFGRGGSWGRGTGWRRGGIGGRGASTGGGGRGGSGGEGVSTGGGRVRDNGGGVGGRGRGRGRGGVGFGRSGGGGPRGRTGGL
ncbi:hypothetical protein CLOM_g2784 [Closterium sp. NIES-68]|nr:hypothetical protein CLOM_g2784 [Closterium sp. NIES-68]